MKKRLLILFFAIATVVCLGVGLAACGGSSSESGDVVADVPSQSTESDTGSASSTTKQAPVYQGMVISSANSTSTLSSDGAVKSYSALAGGASEPGASADATGALTGDVNIGGVDIDTQIYVDDDDTSIEDEITAQFGVTGTGQSIYYADPGEDIFVTVKLSNPDKFEIMSFVLNGEKYSSYMFESGSDLENLIVKLNVGAKAGFSEYTIDEIKYVDGTEIKDVLLDGDTTVKCGVRTDNLPYATVTSETVTLDEISMDVKVTDLYSLISESDGYCMAVLFDGSDDVLYTEYLETGTNTVTFSSLKANTVYQYAVFAVYDDLSGAGVTLSYLYTENFRTKNIVLFDNVEVTKTGVSFSYLWYEGYENATINKLSLESEGEIKLTLLDDDATEVTDLLSNHNYTLTASYIGLDGSVESIHMSFTTYAMETPEVTIDSLTSTKTDITYSVSVTDGDRIGYVSSVEVSKGEEIVSSRLLLSGTVSGLLSDNEYTLTVVYTYDLNDGYGVQTMEVSKSVSTLAKVTPVITIDSLTSTKEEIEYTISVSDEDGVGSITSVTLYKNGESVSTSQAFTGTVSNLLSDNEYTLTVVYAYDLNDGTGEHSLEVCKSVSTLAKTTPMVTIDSLTSTKEEIEYTLSVSDEDGVGSITSVTLYKDGESVSTSEALTGTVSGLLSDNEYTLTVVYAYDLNDGTGEHILGASKSVSTLAKVTPVVTIDSLTSTKEEIEYALSVSDEDGVGTITSVALYKNDESVSMSQALTGTVSNLLSDNEYTLIVVYTYNLNDGYDDRTLEVSGIVSTLAKTTPMVTIDSLTSTKEEIEYTIFVVDEDDVGAITSVTLYKNDESVSTSQALTGTVYNLLSDNEYTLMIVYTYDLNDGTGKHSLKVSKSVSTLAKAVPVISFDTVTSSKTGIEYTVSIDDEDNLGYVSSVTLYLGDESVMTDNSLTGGFTSLLSDNEYTVIVEYTYDANDGRGAQVIIVSESIATEAMTTPEVTIDLTSTKTDISYTLTVADEDEVGEITSVTLAGAPGASEVTTEAAGNIGNLLSNNEYVLTVVYTYDLNDGAGDRILTVTRSVYTLPMTTPVVSIESLTSTQTEINYSIAITDEDGVGSITSVVATIGGNVVCGSEYGVITGLLSDSTYTVTIEYTYDLNDGDGKHTIALSQSIKTLAKTAPIAEIVYIGNDANEGMTFGIIFTDEDNTGTITSIGLYSEGGLKESIDEAYFGEITYVNLTPDVLYTVKVSYEYDLNDGDGNHYTEIELSVLNEIIFKLESVSVITTSAVSEGETITIRADLYNPSNIMFTSAVINGVTYAVSDLSTSTRLLIEIVYEDQFAGGETVLTLSGLTCTMNGADYFIDVDANNTDSVFINGVLVVDKFSIVRFDDYGREEEAEYAFKSEQLYYKVTLENATGYDVYSVTVSSTVYSEDRIYMSDDKQTVYVAMSDTSTGAWYSRSLTSVSYRNTSIDKSKNISFTANDYIRLKSDDIIEISTYEDLLSMNGWEYYKLVNNIDLSGEEWANMNNYMYGVFDGNGYTISNVMAVATYENTALYLGLFYNIQGIVMDLDVCDVLYMVTLDNSTGSSYAVYAGGLAAQSGHVTIKNCNIGASFQITNNGSGTVYVGAISGNGSSDTSLINVVCDVNTIVFYVSGYYCIGYLGNRKEIVVSDCTCDYNLTVDTVKNQYIIDNDYKFSYIDSEYTLVEYLGNEKNLVLPESVNGCNYSIGDEAFYNSSYRSFIVSIVIPDSVTSIGAYAFRACTSLMSIVIPDSVTSIGDYAFFNCASLTSLTLGTGVISIGNDAFYECTYITEINFNAVMMDDLSKDNDVFGRAGKDGSGITVTIGAGVTKIPAYLFNAYGSSYYAPKITTVIFDDNSHCMSIGGYAFYYCDSLISINIPDSVTLIDSYAFCHCESLPSIEIPSSITSITSYTFQSCKSLTSIIIPNSLTSISVFAFSGCSSIMSVYYYGSPSDWNNVSISSNNGTLASATVYYYSETEPTEAGSFWHYVEGEIVIWFEEEN